MEHDCSMCVFGSNLASKLGYSPFDYIPGCIKKKVLGIYILNNPKKCNKFIQKGGARL